MVEEERLRAQSAFPRTEEQLGIQRENQARAVAVLGLLADRVAAVEAAIDRAADPGNPPRTPRHPEGPSAVSPPSVPS